MHTLHDTNKSRTYIILSMIWHTLSVIYGMPIVSVLENNDYHCRTAQHFFWQKSAPALVFAQAIHLASNILQGSKMVACILSRQCKHGSKTYGKFVPWNGTQVRCKWLCIDMAKCVCLYKCHSAKLWYVQCVCSREKHKMLTSSENYWMSLVSILGEMS